MSSTESGITLTHHWMLRMRGGEKVLEQFCRLFPAAEIRCLVFDRGGLSEEIGRHTITGSFFQRFKLARKLYKQLLPLHPFAIGRMKVSEDTKVVIASDASMIKGIRVPDDCLLICYCHSPPRYIWEMADTYAKKSAGMGSIASLVFRAVIPMCQRFDRKAAERVDLFIANSNFVASRIERFYGRESVVVNPPVAINDFDFNASRDDFYLVVSELVPYKRIDIAIESFNSNGRRLVIIGDGPEKERLQRLAGDNIQFLGRQPFEVLKQHYETCRGFIFPGVEDFGITPLEAQAAGAPVIAFGEGGALETVLVNKTGVFFDEQSAVGLNSAIENLDELYRTNSEYLALDCRRNAERFNPERFRNEIVDAVSALLIDRSIDPRFLTKFEPRSVARNPIEEILLPVANEK